MDNMSMDYMPQKQENSFKKQDQDETRTKWELPPTQSYQTENQELSHIEKWQQNLGNQSEYRANSQKDAYVVSVTGDSWNKCGHLLIKLDQFYYHICECYGTPQQLNESGYQEYLKKEKKKEISRIKVDIPYIQLSEIWLKKSLKEKWLWLVIMNNCVTYVEEALNAGGLKRNYCNCIALENFKENKEKNLFGNNFELSLFSEEVKIPISQIGKELKISYKLKLGSENNAQIKLTTKLDSFAKGKYLETFRIVKSTNISELFFGKYGSFSNEEVKWSGIDAKLKIEPKQLKNSKSGKDYLKIEVFELSTSFIIPYIDDKIYAKSEIKISIAWTLDELIKVAYKLVKKYFPKIVEKLITKKALNKIIAKIGTKFIPVIGWILLAHNAYELIMLIYDIYKTDNQEILKDLISNDDNNESKPNFLESIIFWSNPLEWIYSFIEQNDYEESKSDEESGSDEESESSDLDNSKSQNKK